MSLARRSDGFSVVVRCNSELSFSFHWFIPHRMGQWANFLKAIGELNAAVVSSRTAATESLSERIYFQRLVVGTPR